MLFLFNRFSEIFSYLYWSIQPRVRNKWQFTGECSNSVQGSWPFVLLWTLFICPIEDEPALSWILSRCQLSKLFNENKKTYVLYMYILRVWYGCWFLTLSPISISSNDSFFFFIMDKAYLYVCTCMCMSVIVYTCACDYRGHRLTLDVFISHSLL